MDERINLDEKVRALIPELEKAANKNDQDVLAKLLIYADKLVSQYPEIAQVYALRGDIKSLTKNYTAASIDYMQALKYNKSIFDVWYQLLNGLNRVGDWKRLGDYSIQAIDYYPNQPAPYLFYAISLAKNQQLAEAAEYLDEARMLTAVNSSYQIDLIWAGAVLEQEKGNLEAALSAIKPIADSKEINDAELSEYYGDLLFQNGEKALAKEYWEKALKMGAPSVRIKTKLQNS
jgi:tetratricopeptide (TPR) repeat protein